MPKAGFEPALAPYFTILHEYHRSDLEVSRLTQEKQNHQSSWQGSRWLSVFSPNAINERRVYAYYTRPPYPVKVFVSLGFLVLRPQGRCQLVGGSLALSLSLLFRLLSGALASRHGRQRFNGRTGGLVLLDFNYRTLLVKPFTVRGPHMTPYQTVTIRDYGDKYVEASWGWSVTGSKKTVQRGKSKDREANQERCKQRAKARIRHICMAAGFDHLLSLTYRENIVDKERAWKHFEKFVRLIHKYIPDWQYIVTNEQQERGAYHFHMAINNSCVLLMILCYNQI